MSRATRASSVELLAGELRARAVRDFELAFVLGSGLGDFAERLADPVVVPYAELEHMPRSAVEGHAGRLVVGTLGGRRVLAQQGRVHFYEGWIGRQVTRAVRAFCALGCRGVVLTNAAGGVRADWKPGTLMRITDHVNMQGRAALAAGERAAANPWDEGFARAIDSAAAETRVTLEAGVYAAMLGPAYETPAEIRMLRSLGADAVGMSTVAEACAASAAGARVAGISLVTNPAAGLGEDKLDHRDVLAASRRASKRFCALLEAAVPHLAAALV
jgi:purine-nucleoside phosphorylase